MHCFLRGHLYSHWGIGHSPDLTPQDKPFGNLCVFQQRGHWPVWVKFCLAMPGVNLDFLPASQSPEALGSPDSACAESGLEEVIGDLLAQDEAEDEEEQFGVKKFEATLRCAVGEIHSDLQAFGKQVDARLDEAAAEVAPLAETISRLQEENLRLRIQQERLMRQVEALCQVMGLPGPSMHELYSKDCSSLISNKSKTSSGGAPSCMQETGSEKLQDASSCTPQHSLSSAPQETQAHRLLHSQLSVPQEPLTPIQHSVSVSPRTNAPSPAPHPPTFATCRSLSAPSLMANISLCNSTVLLC